MLDDDMSYCGTSCWSWLREDLEEILVLPTPWEMLESHLIYDVSFAFPILDKKGFSKRAKRRLEKVKKDPVKLLLFRLSTKRRREKYAKTEAAKEKRRAREAAARERWSEDRKKMEAKKRRLRDAKARAKRDKKTILPSGLELSR